MNTNSHYRKAIIQKLLRNKRSRIASKSVKPDIKIKKKQAIYPFIFHLRRLY